MSPDEMQKETAGEQVARLIQEHELPVDKPTRNYRLNVGIMIVNQDKKIWIGRRTDAPKGAVYAWQMPQGGMDTGETPEQTAWREMAEETGLKPPHVKLLGECPEWFFYDFPSEIMHQVPAGFVGQQQKWFLFQLIGDDSCFNLHTYKHDEFSEFKWVLPHEVPNVVVPFKKETYEKAVAAFMPLIEKIGK